MLTPACLVLAFGFIAGGDAFIHAPPRTPGAAKPDPRPRSEPDRDSLAGRWLLTMPAGFEYDATIEPGEEPGLYHLQCGALNLQGVYELRSRHLRLVASNQKKMIGLTWEVRNANALVLTVHPKTANVGADYSGATLGRQKQVIGENRTSHR